MKMVFLTGENKLVSDKIYINDSTDVKHLKKVQRVKIGEEIEAFDVETSRKYLVKIVDMNNEGLLGRVVSFFTIQKPKPFVFILQGLVQKGTFEDELHKLSELGVDYIVPILGRHSQNFPINDKYKERLSRICIESAKQVGNPFPSSILDPISILRNFEDVENLINSTEGSKKKIILTWQEVNGKEPKNLLEVIGELEGVDNIFVAVGSEGGFTSEEEQGFGKLGFEPVHLGREIFLKSDTVCIGVSFVLRLLRYK